MGKGKGCFLLFSQAQIRCRALDGFVEGGQRSFPYLVGSGDELTRQLDKVLVEWPLALRVGDLRNCFPLSLVPFMRER